MKGIEVTAEPIQVASHPPTEIPKVLQAPQYGEVRGVASGFDCLRCGFKVSNATESELWRAVRFHLSEVHGEVGRVLEEGSE